MIRKSMVCAVTALALLQCGYAQAVEIEGVLPASLDQPRIYIALSPKPDGKPLWTEGGGESKLLAELMGEKPDRSAPNEIFAIDAFLDTGASGVIVSQQTADGLKVAAAKTAAGKAVQFGDVGIGGDEMFNVSEPLFVRQSGYNSGTDGSDIGRYALVSQAPLRLQIRGEGGVLESLTGGLDIAGMSAMRGQVMVIDARPLKDYDKLKTSLVPPGDPGIPKTTISVPLTYVDFGRFTRMVPKDADPVALAPSPMIGPNPFDPEDRARPVTLQFKGKTSSCTALLDTGAASSIISIARAKALGIDVAEDGTLLNIPADEQFSLPLGGIGGSKTVSGLYIDALVLPASGDEPLRYVHAPVLVTDITVKDAATGKPYTLDAVLGMNYLVASASLTSGLLPDIGDIHDGAFSFIVIDHVKKTLGLQPK